MPTSWTILCICIIGISACSGGGSGSDLNLGGSCPNQAVSDTTDTDSDGIADICDPDDDNDGFSDANDLFPLDSSLPGDYSTPESILSQTVVQNALQEAADQGFIIQALEQKEPPALGGYYLEPEEATVFVASDNGDNVGGTRSGAEFRFDVFEDLTVNSAGVNFSNSRANSFSLSQGALLRGSENSYTRYSRSLLRCALNDSDFSVLFVGISSGDIDANTGDIVDRKRIAISVDTSGELTQQCANLIAGGAEVVGGWSASESTRVFKTDPSEFQFMCVDGDSAFAPTEFWVSSDGSNCTCSLEYETVCD